MNIHVAGLTTNISEEDLRLLFSAYGSVSFVIIMRDKKNGRSKGHAFVEMPNQAQGEQAVNALNNFLMDKHQITVRAVEYRADEFNN